MFFFLWLQIIYVSCILRLKLAIMRYAAFILLVGILFSCENARDGSSKKWKFARVSPNYSDIHFNNRFQEEE